LRIGKTLVRGSRGIFAVQRTLARVLDAQAGGDDEQFAGGVFMLRLEQHSPERRVNGQARQVFAAFRQLPLFVERAEFLQELVATVNRRGRRGIDKRERLDVAKPERLHAQMTSARLARWISGWV